MEVFGCAETHNIKQSICFTLGCTTSGEGIPDGWLSHGRTNKEKENKSKENKRQTKLLKSG
jgi:hypothetical protein